MAERLQRYLARAGVASRRHAEALITAGRVTVNNQLTTTLGTKVEPEDLVALDGKLVMPPDAVSWYVLYKPAGVVTTLDDPQGRPTVLGLLGAIPTRVFPIGRLDWDAEGALLLTDDGSAAHRLLHPSFQVPRTYLAKVKGVPTDESLARLVSGVRLEDGSARAVEVERFQAVERNTWLKVVVAEGRPHLVKRLCAAIGHPVVRLFRPHQAGVSVAGMQPGELRVLRPEELAVIAAVAAGQPVPPVTLTLPARRHGRADEDAPLGGEGDAPPRPPKPPRFGTRPWRHPPGGSESRQKPGARPGSPRPAVQRGHPTDGQRPRPGKGGPWTSTRAGRPPDAEARRPPRTGSRGHGVGAPRDAAGTKGRTGAGHGPPQGRPWKRDGAPGEGFGPRRGAPEFHGKRPPAHEGAPARRRGPPGTAPGGAPRGGFGRQGGESRDFRAQRADARPGYAPERRRPSGARPGASGGRTPERGKALGKGFGTKAPGRGDFSGERRGGQGLRRGPPGGKPSGGGRWGGGGGRGRHPGSGATAGHGQNGRGRPAEGRRGPPRPRGGQRGPRR